MKNPPLIARTYTLLTALGLLLFSLQVHAATVCLGSGTIATTCTGVMIKGTSYDVTWVLPSYSADSGTSTPPLTFTTNSDAALAADAINALLNSGGFTTIEYGTGSGTSSTFVAPNCSEPCYYVAYRINATTVSTWESRYTGAIPTWFRDTTDLGGGVIAGNLNYTFAQQNTRPTAVFAPSAVPLPASLILLLTGMGAIGWVARRRRPMC